MKTLIRISFVALLLSVVFMACEEDETPITGDALFSYEADGMTMTFTNLSDVSGEVTYAWDFGDDNSSVEENPVHTYEVKGEYNVTLTVTDEQGGTHPVSTKVVADKATRIDLADDSFEDWASVTEEEYMMSAGGELAGIVKSAKIDYDGQNVYVYMEFEGTVEKGFVLDVFVDTDDDATTGSALWIWPNSGLDYLVEGQFTLPAAHEGILDFYFAGETQDAWAWSADKPFTTGYLTIGNIANVGSNGAVEFGFDRAKFTGLDNDVINLAVMLSDPETWASVGFAPNQVGEDGTATAHILDMR